MLYSTKNFLYYTIAAYQTTSRADIAATHGQPKPPRQRAAATEGQPTSCYICETSPITPPLQRLMCTIIHLSHSHCHSWSAVAKSPPKSQRPASASTMCAAASSGSQRLLSGST